MGLTFEHASEAVGSICFRIQITDLTQGEFDAIREEFFNRGVLFFVIRSSRQKTM